MKKVFLIGAFLCSIFAVNAYAGSNDCNPGCEPACPADQASGNCYCQYVHYQPRTYYTKRCVEEQYYCPRTCCRYVPQYYQVQKCRYVPQYYCETYCKQVPEYYTVQDCKTRTKTVCEPHVEYIPSYYWKQECKPCAPACAPACPSPCN